MNRAFLPTLAAVCATAVITAPTHAGSRCHHPGCGTTCRIVIDSHRYVADECVREIRVTVPKLRCQTDLEVETSRVVSPTYHPMVEPGHATVSVPECKQETYCVVRRKCCPETKMKSITVDAGHWTTVCRKCTPCGPKVCEARWCPHYKEVCVPTTELVCRDVVESRVRDVYRDTPKHVCFPIETSERRDEVEEVSRHVPVTRAEWVTAEIVVKVPFVTARHVPCRTSITTDD
jgi:hypothetical protein